MPDAVEPRSSTVVVTSENRAAFMDRKLEIAAPPKAASAEPAKVEVKEVGKTEPEPKAEPAKAEPKAEEPKKEDEKKSHPIKERMSELTNARKEAEARAEKAEKEAAELRAKLAPPKQEEPKGAPKREDYANDDEYANAVIDHRVEQKLAEREKAQREQAEKAVQEKQAAEWMGRVAELKKEMPDYDDIINSSTAKVHQAVQAAIFESEAGPRILVHIAQTEGEAERLAKMTVTRAVKEIGKLEDKFLKPKAEPKAEVKKAPEISQAPAPISPLKGASAPVDLPINSKGEWTGTYKEFKEAVAAGKIK